MSLARFLNNSNNIEKDSFIWNMSGSMLLAFQSVIMLMVLTRTVGIVEAGIFTIANANANLFINIGKYGMRYFQASDVQHEFTFREYWTSRIITAIAMLVVSSLYLLYVANKNGYSGHKSMVILWMCLFKVVDVIEDVYLGNFQRENRLDVSGKILTIRMFLTIIFFAVSVIVSGNLLSSLIATTVFTAIIFLFLKGMTYPQFRVQGEKLLIAHVRKLLYVCFPLFAGAFLSFYIGNAPKYAIDGMLSDELQAVYGFISMPVFVIGLLNNFIFNPMLHHMSILWEKGKIGSFVKKTVRQAFVVMGITLVCIVGAYLLGVPVLSWLYNTDLTAYKSELLILLVGGGFLGLSGLLNAVITIIRFQKNIMWGYLIVAILAFVLSDPVVKQGGLMGASLLYMSLMAILCVIFVFLLAVGIRKRK